MLLLAALAAMLLLVEPVLAQRNLNVAAAPANEQRVALVIGNSAYKDSPLANPVNDAADIAKALQDAGFKVILKRNANSRDMRQAIREFGGELRRAQVGLFYFAGHGVQVKGANYLVPVGADIQGEADVEDLAIDAYYALRTMEEAQVKVSIVILDACRNNPFARSFRSASRGLMQMTAATGSLIAFATAPGAVAADGSGRNGIYTKHLLASLSQADTDILKVFQRTRAAVVKETGGKQTPWESTSLVGDFYFRAPAGGTQVATVAPSAPADPAAADRAFWESLKNSKDPEEFKAYLEQFPGGRFVGLARARLKSLTAAARPPAQVASVVPSTQTTPAPPRTGPPPKRVEEGPWAGIFINGRPLLPAQFQELQATYGAVVPPGRYWYDPQSGLYGVWGREAAGFIRHGHDFAPLPPDASHGNTGVFINGREINMTEALYFQQIFGAVYRGRWWLDGQTGNVGLEGNPMPMANLVLALRQSQQSQQGGGGYRWRDSWSGGSGGVQGRCVFANIPGGSSVMSGCD
jgi:uncharacterized caspase-like protein